MSMSKWAQWGQVGAAYSTIRMGALGEPRVRSRAVTWMPNFSPPAGSAASLELPEKNMKIAGKADCHDGERHQSDQ